MENISHASCGFHTADHRPSLINELVHHLPLAILSVAAALSIAGIIDFLARMHPQQVLFARGMHGLFHLFHFQHILFAVAGSFVMFARVLPRRPFISAFLSIVSALVFCTLSDVLIPHIAGKLLGVSMSLHLCLWTERSTVAIFSIIGLLNGIALTRHEVALKGIALTGHISHIFVSSLASFFYLLAHGFDTWTLNIGPIFLFLILGVVIPCTCADVVFPILCAKFDRKR